MYRQMSVSRVALESYRVLSHHSKRIFQRDTRTTEETLAEERPY